MLAIRIVVRQVRNLVHGCCLALAVPWALAGAPASAAEGQAFPQRQVRIVVPFPAGGTSDALARILAERLAAHWQSAVVVENLPGANGIVAAGSISRAPADGHVLMLSPLGPVTVNALLYQRLDYKPQDFVVLALPGRSPSVLAVRASLPAAGARELIALARAAPEQFTYASQGFGSTSHLTAAMFEAAAGVRLRHIPYNGSRLALQDLMSGQIDLFFDNISTPLQFHRDGRVKILAVASLRRAPQLPEVPTLDETGLRGFESSTDNLLVAPIGLPPALARQINAAANAALNHPEVREKLAALGIASGSGTVEEAALFVAEKTANWQKIIRSAGIRVD